MKKLKRILVDVKKLPPEVLKKLVALYPDGYGDNDIISFKDHKGNRIEAVEVISEDTKYLVKISATLVHTMANYEEDAPTPAFDEVKSILPEAVSEEE